jgi:hypothetical protein
MVCIVPATMKPTSARPDQGDQHADADADLEGAETWLNPSDSCA